MQLFESKLDLAIQKYPQFTEDLERLAASSLRTYTKFIEWFIKQRLNKEPAEEIIELLSKFELVGQRLEQKDINAYKTLGDLRGAVEELGVSKRQQKQETPWWLLGLKDGVGDAKKIFDGDNCVLYAIPTTEASQYYGKGTKWCIVATQSRNYFDQYVGQGNTFFFLISKNLEIGEEYRKVALQVKNNRIEGYWTADDHDRSSEMASLTLLRASMGLSREDARNIERLVTASVRQVDVKQKLRATLRSSDEQFIDNINELMRAIGATRVHKNDLADIFKAIGSIEEDLSDREVEALEDAAEKYLTPIDLIVLMQHVPGLDAKRFSSKMAQGGAQVLQYFKSVPGANVEAYLMAACDNPHNTRWLDLRDLIKGRKISQALFDKFMSVPDLVTSILNSNGPIITGLKLDSAFDAIAKLSGAPCTSLLYNDNEQIRIAAAKRIVECLSEALHNSLAIDFINKLFTFNKPELEPYKKEAAKIFFANRGIYSVEGMQIYAAIVKAMPELAIEQTKLLSGSERLTLALQSKALDTARSVLLRFPDALREIDPSLIADLTSVELAAMMRAEKADKKTKIDSNSLVALADRAINDANSAIDNNMKALEEVKAEVVTYIEANPAEELYHMNWSFDQQSDKAKYSAFLNAQAAINPAVSKAAKLYTRIFAYLSKKDNSDLLLAQVSRKFVELMKRLANVVIQYYYVRNDSDKYATQAMRDVWNEKFWTNIIDELYYGQDQSMHALLSRDVVAMRELARQVRGLPPEN